MNRNIINSNEGPKAINQVYFDQNIDNKASS